MADKSREQQKAASGHQTVLDPLRPAVVVRRRVTVVEGGGMNVPRAFSSEQPIEDDEDDENGPPSSVNVARALASLRADELKRVEELLSADDRDEEERTASARAREAEALQLQAAVAPPPPPPTVTVGKSISLSKLADQMGMQAKDLTATLVASGFYSLHAKTVLPRGTARTIAELFGWQVNELPDGAPGTEEEPIVDDIPESIAAVSTKPKSKKPKSGSPTSSKRKR
jgi:hypothetical protein